MFDDYYEFDPHDMACYFNKEKQKQEKPIMLDLLKQLNDRLAEINDGSFVVKDYITDYLQESLDAPKQNKKAAC